MPQLAIDRNYGEWSFLPSLVVEEVYSYLSHSDQVSMSLVCKNWKKGYSSPSVWRNIELCIVNNRTSFNINRFKKFTEKYGHMMKNLKVTWNSEFFSLESSWCICFDGLLFILGSKSTLTSITLKNMKDAGFMFDWEREYILRAIEKFLKTQHQLVSIKLVDCFFSYEEGFSLLQVITEQCRDSLIHLSLRNCVKVYVMDDDVSCLCLCLNLPKLRTLEFNFELVFVKGGIEALTKFRTDIVLKIIICYCANTNYYLSEREWKILNKTFPKLQVEFNFETSSASCEKIKCLIVPHMPITSLNYRKRGLGLSLWNPGEKIDALLVHLSNVEAYDYLEIFRLEWDDPIPNLAHTFITFLREFKRLKHFQLVTEYPSKGMETLLEYLLENRSCLEYLYIIVRNIASHEEYEKLKNLFDRYAPLLNEIGISSKNELLTSY